MLREKCLNNKTVNSSKPTVKHVKMSEFGFFGLKDYPDKKVKRISNIEKYLNGHIRMNDNDKNQLMYKYWGKADKEGNYHLLVYHCLDVAAVGKVYELDFYKNTGLEK